MAFEFNKKLPIPKETKEMYPISDKIAEIKKVKDEEIRNIFTGDSNKFLVIIGPCSADNEDAVLDYTTRLARVQEKVKDKLVIVPRVYTGKPRTNGSGYKGMLHQPDPEKAPDMFAGIVAIRRLHMRVIEETEFPTADEMLYPENYRYLSDILSYVAVGARSVEDQHHRMCASGIECPVGMKNPTSGDYNVMLNSVAAAQMSHQFIYRGWDVTTDGNPYAHTILRGSTSKHGANTPNYHFEDLQLLAKMYAAKDLKNPACIVDANHSNSNKQYMEQIRIVNEVLHSRNYSPEISKLVKGVMIESYIESGNQKVGDGCYGKSITDPCLGWVDSEKLLYEIAEKV